MKKRQSLEPSGGLYEEHDKNNLSFKDCIRFFLTSLMNFISWNVSGINDPLKDSFVRELVKRKNTHVLGLIETKLQEV